MVSADYGDDACSNDCVQQAKDDVTIEKFNPCLTKQ